MVYDAVEHVILNQIRMSVLAGTNNKHVEQYFEAGKATKALGKWLLRNDEFLAPISPFVQAQAIDAIADQRRVVVFGSTSMETRPRKYAAVAAEALCTRHRFIQALEALVRSYKGRKSRRAHQRTCSHTWRNRNHKSR